MDKLNPRMDVVKARADIVQAFLPWQQEDPKRPAGFGWQGFIGGGGTCLATTNQPLLIDRAVAAKRSVWVIKPITLSSAPTITTAWVRPSVSVGRSENAAVSG